MYVHMPILAIVYLWMRDKLEIIIIKSIYCCFTEQLIVTCH